LRFKNSLTRVIDGVWDKHVEDIGNIAQAHTNLTEIDASLELMWRNNINPDRVVMGLGFYGRSKSSRIEDSRPQRTDITRLHNERPQMHESWLSFQDRCRQG
jgi:GH18 family chitinase